MIFVVIFEAELNKLKNKILIVFFMCICKVESEKISNGNYYKGNIFIYEMNINLKMSPIS